MAVSIFWAAAGGIALVVAAILILSLRRKASNATNAAGFDKQVYRDQLSEIERDLSRRVIGEDEAQRLRSEVARRLLDADRAEAQAVLTTDRAVPMPVLVLVALVIAASFGGYALLGQPGYGDLPMRARLELAEEQRENRPSQEALEAQMPPQPPLKTVDPEFLKLVDKLRDTVATRPEDLQGHQLLARNEANLGNFTAAYKAQAKVIELKGDQANSDDLLRQATLMIQAAGGQVSPEAEMALLTVLHNDPENVTALFFIGVVNMQVGRYDLAFRYWRQLVDVAPTDHPLLAEVRGRIEALAELAGVRYQLPPSGPALPGPSADQVQAAGDMSAEDRQAMIRSMVEGLNDRLASEGGTAEEWGRLILSLGSLGETDRARAIWAEAQKTFAGREEELETVRASAKAAGVAE